MFSKGQMVSFEMLMIFTILLAAMGLILPHAIRLKDAVFVGQNLKNLEKVGYSLANKIECVYLQGEGAESFERFVITQDANISKEVYYDKTKILLESGGKRVEVTSYVDFSISGDKLELEPGDCVIFVKAVEGGNVELSRQ